MNKNYIADVAKLLGVELNEEFRVKTRMLVFEKLRYKFTEDKLMVKDPHSQDWNDYTDELLIHLLTGDARIVIPTWKPKKNECYYTPDLRSIFPEPSALKHTWDRDKQDLQMYENGLVFKEEKDAIDLADEMMKFARSKREL